MNYQGQVDVASDHPNAGSLGDSVQVHAQKRAHGLDSLRAAAIIMVLIYHYRAFISNQDMFGFMSQLGWVGVDLFFVLSGYLIGNQILSAVSKEQVFSLKSFYARRALRTLPNYYFVLALYFAFPVALSGSSTASIWEFLTFTQNIGMRPGQTFTHSWSLCIEEQFYLVLPITILCAMTLMRSVKFLWVILILGFCGAAALRGISWYNYGQESITAADYWEHIYYSSFTRFDELLPGVAVALLKNFHSHRYQALMEKGNLLLLSGVLATAGVFYILQHYFYIDGYGFSLLVAIVGYSAISISFALLVLAALSSQTQLNRLRIPGAVEIALWSYATYLVHRPIFKVMPPVLEQWGFDRNSYFAACIIFAISLLAGWVVYTCVETPFMKLRDRYFPSNSKA